MVPDSISLRPMSALIAEWVAPESKSVLAECEVMFVLRNGLGSLLMWGLFGIVPQKCPRVV